MLLRAALNGAGVVAIAPLLAACSSAAPNAQAPAGAGQPGPTSPPAAVNGNGGTLKIGLLSGFSGPYAAFGPDMASAIDVFLDKHNGMIGGLKATIIKEDEGAVPQDALNKARKLVEQDKVDVLMGLVSS